MFKRFIITSAIFSAVLLAPAMVSARTECRHEGDYGQNVVCWEVEEQVLGVHEPIETGIADNPLFYVSALIGASGVLLVISKKAKAASLFN